MNSPSNSINAAELLLQEVVFDAERQMALQETLRYFIQSEPDTSTPYTALFHAACDTLSGAALTIHNRGKATNNETVSLRALDDAASVAVDGLEIHLRSIVAAGSAFSRIGSPVRRSKIIDGLSIIGRNTHSIAIAGRRGGTKASEGLMHGMVNPGTMVRNRVRDMRTENKERGGDLMGFPEHVFKLDEENKLRITIPVERLEGSGMCPALAARTEEGGSGLAVFNNTISQVALEEIFPRSIEIIDD